MSTSTTNQKSHMSKPEPVPVSKPSKKPRRSDAEIAADYAARAIAARQRGVKARPEFQSLETARDALVALDTTRFAAEEVAQIVSVTGYLGREIGALLSAPAPRERAIGYEDEAPE